MKTKNSDLIKEESELTGLFLGAVLITAAISAGIAILYAPKSGKETREQIKDLAGKQKDNLTDQINRGKEKATQAVDTVKNKYSQVAEQAKSKLETFTQKEGTTEPTDLSENGF